MGDLGRLFVKDFQLSPRDASGSSPTDEDDGGAHPPSPTSSPVAYLPSLPSPEPSADGGLPSTERVGDREHEELRRNIERGMPELSALSSTESSRRPSISATHGSSPSPLSLFRRSSQKLTSTCGTQKKQSVNVPLRLVSRLVKRHTLSIGARRKSSGPPTLGIGRASSKLTLKAGGIVRPPIAPLPPTPLRY